MLPHRGCTRIEQSGEKVGYNADVILLPRLPYPTSGLEPVLSTETVWRHYHRLHAGYIRRLNKYVRDPEATAWSVATSSKWTTERFWAGQAWMHAWYWTSMRPPTDLGRMAARKPFEDHTGTSVDDLLADMLAVVDVLDTGSAWLWICRGPHGVHVLASRDGQIPDGVALGIELPLLVCDLWEHAYICDIADRSVYVREWINQLADWKRALSRWIDPGATHAEMTST